MAIKALKCPNCDANIQVDDDREFGFCSYCGAQVQTREVVEIRYTGEVQLNQGPSFQQCMENGEAYLKMADYYRAEQALYEAIRNYPGRPEGYDMLIRTITRDHQYFIAETKERVFKLADKMVAVADDREKEQYETIRRNIHAAYGFGMMQQQQDHNVKKLARTHKVIKENVVILVICLVLVLIGKVVLQNDMVALIAGIVGGCSLFILILNIVVKKSLLRKNSDLDRVMQEAMRG